MENQRPNIDGASDGDLVAIMDDYLKSFIRANLDDMLPAIVVSYDDNLNRAIVKPLVMLGTTEGQKVARPAIPNIPVFRFGAGGFFIRFPVKTGDFGWLKANDRDISLVFQRGLQQDHPNTKRLHNFSDAMFFPDTQKGWNIDSENKDAMVIQSLNGGTCIALHDGKLTIKADSAEVTIPQTKWVGNIVQEGTLTSNGMILANGGGIASDSSISISSPSLKHNDKEIGALHLHSGVQSGSDNSGTVV